VCRFVQNSCTLQVFTYYTHCWLRVLTKKDITSVYNVFVAFRQRLTRGKIHACYLDISTVGCPVYSIICVYPTRVCSSRKGVYYNEVYLSPGYVHTRPLHTYRAVGITVYTGCIACVRTHTARVIFTSVYDIVRFAEGNLTFPGSSIRYTRHKTIVMQSKNNMMYMYRGLYIC